MRLEPMSVRCSHQLTRNTRFFHVDDGRVVMFTHKRASLAKLNGLLATV